VNPPDRRTNMLSNMTNKIGWKASDFALPAVDGRTYSRRDLFEAMREVVETGHGPKEQLPSMGCSIKWRR